jgi:outer membrane protein
VKSKLFNLDYDMKKILFPISILLQIASMGYAQQAPEPLIALVKNAIDYAPKIKEQQALFRIGEYKTTIQQAALKPVVQGEVGVTRIDPVAKAVFATSPSSAMTLQFQPNMNYNTNVGIYHTLYDWGRQQLQIEKSKLENNLVFGGIENIKSGYAYQISSLYYTIIYLNKAIEVQKEQLTLINNNAKVIDDKFKKGDELNYNQVATEVRYKNAEMRLTDLQSQLERQYIVLGSLIGKDAHGLVPTEANFELGLPMLTGSTAYDLAQVNNADLRFFKDKDLLAEKEVKLASLSNRPTLSANAIVGVKNGYVPRINNETPAFNEDFKLNSIVGIKLAIPIYSGHRGAYSVQMAKVNQDLLKYSAENANVSIKRDLDIAINDYKTAQSKYQLSEKNVFQAQYALKLAQVRYTNGIITQLEIESTENALQEAQFNRLQYQYLMTLAQLDLNRISGVKFW